MKTLAWTALVCALLASEALGAIPNNPPPQPAGNANAPAVWIGMLLMVIIVAVILTISLMPSRRSHQD